MNLHKEFDDILKTGNITSLFQPIIRLNDGEIIGYESLSRGPKDSYFTSPLNLLDFADKNNKLWELELLFRTKAIKKAKFLDKNKLLFINVDPNIIKDVNFSKGFTKEFLKENDVSPECIIFEITERTAIEDYESFLSILNNYTEQGYKIAIDDAGSGYSGLKTITKTKPNYIKIDMDLIRDIDKDPFKQALIKAFVNLALTTNTKLIAEGIETKEELKTLIKLGIYAGQGYFIQRPAVAFLDVPEKIKSLVKKYNKLTNNIYNYSDSYNYIGDIMDTNPYFNQYNPCEEIKLFLDNNSFEGVCLVDNDYPVGLIMKYNLDSQLAKKYGYAVYSRRPVSLVMDNSPLIVDYYTPINLVTKEAMNREIKKTYDNIIVTKGNKYAGIISIKKLLEYSSSNNGFYKVI